MVSGGSSGNPEPAIYEAFHTGGANNFGKYSDPTMDQLTEQSRAAGDASTRASLYKKIQEQVIDQVPIMYVTHLVFGIVSKQGLTGFALYGQGNVLWDRVGYTKKQ
jgi:peptide/nickel transport system substrate-binding protein